jgi:hypothetical protein
MIELTAAQIAELRKVSRNYVYKAKLPKTPGGGYDLSDPLVWEWVIEPSVKQLLRQARKGDPSDLEHAVMDELEREKLKADIQWKERQSRKLDREHEMKSMNLISRGDVALAFGAFIAGLKNNFLQIGNRVARGDTKLRDRIEREVTKSIEKTVKAAQDETRKIIRVEIGDE